MPSRLDKYLPELPGIGGLGIAAAPRKSLPLNMDQASLHRYIRPEFVKGPHHGGIAIDGETSWAQTASFKGPQERCKLRLRALGDTVAASHQPMTFRVHQGDKASRSAEECSVQDEVLALHQVRDRLRRRLLQVSINHTVKLPRAMPALARQLPNRVSFDDPASEPFQLVSFSGLGISPTKGALA